MTKYQWHAQHGQQWLTHAQQWEKMLAPLDTPIIAWAESRADERNPGQKCRLADVACGAGGTTLALASALPNDVKVHGFDMSSDLIKHATQRAVSDNSRAMFKALNVQQSVPKKASYELLISRFGVMFFSDPDAAFRNIRKMLAPRGEFLFAVWGPQSANPWSQVVREVIGEITPLPTISTDSPHPFRYGELEPLLSTLDQVGFQQVRSHTWRGQLQLGGGMDAAQAAQFVLASYELGALVQKAGEAAVSRAQAELTQAFTAFEKDGVVQCAAQANFVSGYA
jgi:ubiquinone/menaquinone biosynthesis C-methylase UbiE